MFTNTSSDRVAIEEGISVGSGGRRSLLADVYVPPAGSANGIGVLLVHGGGWYSGDRSQLRGYGILLGRVGFTCVACEYRLSGEARWPAQIEDARAAFEWTRAHADELGVDPGRIAVEGNSAGAHLALMLAGMPETQKHVSACIAIYGPASLMSADRRPRANATVDVMGQLFGDADGEVRRLASPITYVSASFPPTMLVHGNADETVPVLSSERLYQAITDAGAKAELHVFEGQPHAFDRAPDYGRLCAQMMSVFLKRHVLAPVGVK